MLIGANGRSLTLNLASQGNPRPTDYFQNYRFRIHADPRLQWSPASHEVDFISVLSNLSEIRIKGTFSRGDVGFMSQFSMGSATDVFELDNDGIPRGRTDWVERCVCPSAYSGQFCQFCRPGHKRADPFGGPLTKCVPCQCNEHAKECDAESGKCKCEHNTAGDTCAQCARGFYGNALVGKFGECRNCNCPDGGPCVLADEASGDEAVICIECPEGYGGRNGNVDPNAIGQCDAISGQCIRCDYHTAGWNCERCAPGFWGNALDETKVSVDERVGQLQNDSLKTAQLLNDTLEMAKEIREEVDKVNDEAAMCLGLAKTSSNWMSKEKNASEQFYKTLLLSVDDLKMEMNKSENELAKVREAFAVKEAEARREMKVAEEALREGRERDKEAEKDNDWMKQQTERAEKAVRESEQIEETMREVLEKLEDKDPNSTAGKGNKQVGILQTEFETRLNKSGALDKQIAKIEKRLATGKLQKMTKNALEKAMKVKMRAVESNESVAELGEQSKHSQKQIELLKEHLAKLEQNIGEAEAKAKAAKQMVELETAQKNDEELQQTAKVIRKADGQLKRVGANEETLEALQNKLNSMDTTQLSDEELDSLESKLDQLEEAYRVSDVEQTIRQQQQKIYQQQLESSQLRANIDMLQEEERRLRVIMESMWPKCMNVVHIEQNGQ
uniref:Laminin EGF-like domain-containing protein n=1 Tax=Globodera pallida TaxID=36090 RepID=A0A183CJ16_GLOPA